MLRGYSNDISFQVQPGSAADGFGSRASIELTINELVCVPVESRAGMGESL